VNFIAGPFQWPIIGNLLEVHMADPDFPHLAFAKLSGKYGDIMSLKLGTINTGKCAKLESASANYSYDGQI